jgi:Cu-Zn family superoxide dismutase
MLALVVASAACTDDSAPGVSGASGAGGTAGSGGAAGSGTAGTGGDGPGSGGTPGTAGSAGTAGTAGTGGGPSDEGGSDGGDGAVDAAVGDRGLKLASSTGAWVVYDEPYGDGGAANPITMTIMGSAEAFAVTKGGMQLTLSVTGLPPNRAFGSHLHKLACNNNKAGGHYQNMPFPDGGSANDPTFANAANEAWLDFTTDATGAGSATTTVLWQPRAGEANAIMLHDMKTADGGVAGAKLACLNMPF